MQVWLWYLAQRSQYLKKYWRRCFPHDNRFTLAIEREKGDPSAMLRIWIFYLCGGVIICLSRDAPFKENKNMHFVSGGDATTEKNLTGMRRFAGLFTRGDISLFVSHETTDETHSRDRLVEIIDGVTKATRRSFFAQRQSFIDANFLRRGKRGIGCCVSPPPCLGWLSSQ